MNYLCERDVLCLRFGKSWRSASICGPFLRDGRRRSSGSRRNHHRTRLSWDSGTLPLIFANTSLFPRRLRQTSPPPPSLSLQKSLPLKIFHVWTRGRSDGRLWRVFLKFCRDDGFRSSNLTLFANKFEASCARRVNIHARSTFSYNECTKGKNTPKIRILLLVLVSSVYVTVVLVFV